MFTVMLSIDVAAILTVDTRPVPPDTSVITVTVLAGITALAWAEADMAARRWTPGLRRVPALPVLSGVRAAG